MILRSSESRRKAAAPEPIPLDKPIAINEPEPQADFGSGTETPRPFLQGNSEEIASMAKEARQSAEEAPADTQETAPAPVAGREGSEDAPAKKVSCPNCKAVNLEGMKFCGQCGQPLSGKKRSSKPAAEASSGSTQFMHAADVKELSQPRVRLVTIDARGQEGVAHTLARRNHLWAHLRRHPLF
jgi:hypothetical protein